MPPANLKAAKSAPRKRTRKRKRRAVSSSSSSSSSSDSPSSDDEQQTVVRPTTEPARQLSDSDSESESESSDSSSSSSSVAPQEKGGVIKQAQLLKSARAQLSPSPSPPPPEIPSFLPEKQDPSGEQKEREMKEKFRKFWMSSVADGFCDDLEQLRKEPNLGTARLTLLIDSLASGAEVFSSETNDGATEMDVMLG